MPSSISASIIITITGIVGESLSFSTLQMQRWLRPDSNAGLATYRHSRHFNAKVAAPGFERENFSSLSAP